MDPYSRILEASSRERGVRLSPDEVNAMAFDDGIARRAAFIADNPKVWVDQLKSAGIYPTK